MINLYPKKMKIRNANGEFEDFPAIGGATEEQIEQVEKNKNDINELQQIINSLTFGVHTDGLIYIFVDGKPVGNGLNINNGIVEPNTPSTSDNITLANGVMTIFALANEPISTDNVLAIS